MINKRKEEAEDKSKKKDKSESKKRESKQTGCTESEIVAVICHELGHWYYSHIYKLLAIDLISLLFIFKLCSLLFYHSVIYQGFGFAPGDQPRLIGLTIIIDYIFLSFFSMFGYATSFISRHFEFQADGFAKKHNYESELINSLSKLKKDNLSLPVYVWLYSALILSHPPLLERIEALKTIDD